MDTAAKYIPNTSCMDTASEKSGMDIAAEEYPWHIRHGYSSWSIPPDKSEMDTAAEAYPDTSGMDTAVEEYS